MFEYLQHLPADPLLGLIEAFNNDPNPNKVDLGVGVYRNNEGQTPVMSAVKSAERTLLQTEATKAYVGPVGNLDFNLKLSELILGSANEAQNISTIQTPGGSAALRVLADMILKVNSLSDHNAVIWVSDPTWANHVPLLSSAGLTLKTYPYYNFETSILKFDEMMSTLAQACAGDVVLLHACCHNPSGADLTMNQWREVIDLCSVKHLKPLIDLAYLGFGASFERDLFGLRLAVNSLPEVLVSVSCSKTFGLYRERVGMAMVISEQADHARVIDSHMKSITRSIYSMPPSHGASVVAEILMKDTLKQEWMAELSLMCGRINKMRGTLSTRLNEHTGDSRFDFIVSDQGMFSFLGLTADQVHSLAKSHGIYMAESSRINVSGLNDSNIDHCIDAFLGFI